MGMLLHYHLDKLDKMAKSGVSVQDTPNVVLEEKEVEKKVEEVIETVVEEKDEVAGEKDFRFSKTEVQRMNTAKLQEVAKEYGLDETMSGNKIKAVLIEKFNL